MASKKEKLSTSQGQIKKTSDVVAQAAPLIGDLVNLCLEISKIWDEEEDK